MEKSAFPIVNVKGLEKGKVYVMTCLQSQVSKEQIQQIGKMLMRMGVAVMIYPVVDHDVIKIHGGKGYKEAEVAYNGEIEMGETPGNHEEGTGDKNTGSAPK